MPKTAPAKENTKNQLLEAGINIMIEKGYNNTGIQEVLQTTGVPKGSFYYYFDSKEDFGLKIIDYFEQQYNQKLCLYLDDKSKSSVERLRAYCEDGKKNFEAQRCRRGCLIGNLSQEMADQSEAFRARLEEVLTKWRNRFAQTIKEGQSNGEISKELDTVELAEFFLSGWEGAVMRSKTTKNVAPQQAFINIMFGHVLRK